jgi:hypothetical protein
LGCSPKAALRLLMQPNPKDFTARTRKTLLCNGLRESRSVSASVENRPSPLAKNPLFLGFLPSVDGKFSLNLPLFKSA